MCCASHMSYPGQPLECKNEILQMRPLCRQKSDPLMQVRKTSFFMNKIESEDLQLRESIATPIQITGGQGLGSLHNI